SSWNTWIARTRRPSLPNHGKKCPKWKPERRKFMLSDLLPTLLTDLLWIVIAAGWLLLVILGLEVDKPLSGGIPGHITAEDEHAQVFTEGLWGQIGVVGGWIVFGLATLSLPIILYWIFTTH